MRKKKPTTEIKPTISEVRIQLAMNGWVMFSGSDRGPMCMGELWIANTPQEIGAIMAKHGVKPPHPARKRR